MAGKVFDTTELLESILLYLPVKDILLSQRVSKAFQATIQGSKKLQRALFFEQSAEQVDQDGSLSSLVVLNPLLVHTRLYPQPGEQFTIKFDRRLGPHSSGMRMYLCRTRQPVSFPCLSCPSHEVWTMQKAFGIPDVDMTYHSCLVLGDIWQTFQDHRMRLVDAVDRVYNNYPLPVSYYTVLMTYSEALDERRQPHLTWRLPHGHGYDHEKHFQRSSRRSSWLEDVLCLGPNP